MSLFPLPLPVEIERSIWEFDSTFFNYFRSFLLSSIECRYQLYSLYIIYDRGYSIRNYPVYSKKKTLLRWVTNNNNIIIIIKKFKDITFEKIGNFKIPFNYFPAFFLIYIYDLYIYIYLCMIYIYIYLCMIYIHI